MKENRGREEEETAERKAHSDTGCRGTREKKKKHSYRGIHATEKGLIWPNRTNRQLPINNEELPHTNTVSE